MFFSFVSAYTRKERYPCFLLFLSANLLHFSKEYQKEKYTDSSALEYYENGRGKILIHPETDALIHHLLKYLSEHGLDQTIHYIITEIKE